jgi:hypothetical protein
MDVRTPLRESGRIGLQPPEKARRPRRASVGVMLSTLERRIDELEHIASSQAHELKIQFERIAQLQAECDVLRIRFNKP